MKEAYPSVRPEPELRAIYLDGAHFPDQRAPASLPEVPVHTPSPDGSGSNVAEPALQQRHARQQRTAIDPK